MGVSDLIGKRKKMWVGTNNGLEFCKREDGFQRNNVGEKKKDGGYDEQWSRI